MSSLSDHTVSPPPLPVEPKAASLEPRLLEALRGIWLFTWRPQMTWRRLPAQLLLLLLLPALVYLTTPSPEGWAQRHVLLIHPGQQVNDLARRLQRAGQPLRPEQHQKLLQVFTEESARLNTALSSIQTGDAGAEQQRNELRRLYDRLEERVQTVLDTEQMSPFRTFKQRELIRRQAQITPVWGRTEPFYHWLLDLYFFVILPLQCVRGSGGLIRDELQADTLGFLLTRPISRARLLLLKYVTQTAWLELVLLLETLLLFGVAGLRQLPEVRSLMPLLLAAQIMAVPAWSGLGILLGQLTKRYMPLALVYGFIVEMGIGRIPSNINTLSLMRHLKSLLAHHSGVQDIYKWTPEAPWIPLGALVLAAAVFVAAAALLFTYREYHQTAEMQK